MKRIRNKIFFGLLTLLLLVVGCKTPAPTTSENETKSLPETYITSKDTSNLALIKWDIFYKDPYMNHLIKLALTNNYDLLAAMQKIEIVKNTVRLNKGMLFPTLDAQAATSIRKFGRYTMDGAGNASTEIKPGEIVPEHLPDYFLGLSASWEVDVWGKLRNKKKAALARYTSSIEAQRAIQTSLVAEIATTYFELLALDHQLDIVRETIRLQKEALEIIKIKKEAGVLNELAVKQFEGQVLNSSAMEYEILQNIKENENEINFLTGEFPKAVPREKFQFNNNITNEIREGVPSQMLQNRPDIRQAEMDLLASKYDLNSAKRAFYPSFTITAAGGYQAFETALWLQSPESFAYNILGGLTMPLLNRSAIKAQFNTAKANQAQALLNYQKTILNAYKEVSNELSKLDNLKQLYKLKNQEVSTYNLSISISNDLFKTGRATYLEVLTAQRTALQSKIELIDTRKRQHLAVINLYRTLGGGWE